MMHPPIYWRVCWYHIKTWFWLISPILHYQIFHYQIWKSLIRYEPDIRYLELWKWLIWSGQLQQRSGSAPIRGSDRIIINGARRTRDRPKQTWKDAIKKGMIMVNLIEMALTITEWKKRTNVIDHKIMGLSNVALERRVLTKVVERLGVHKSS